MWTLNGNFVGIHRASTRIPPAVYANSNTWIVVTLGQIPTMNSRCAGANSKSPIAGRHIFVPCKQRVSTRGTRFRRKQPADAKITPANQAKHVREGALRPTDLKMRWLQSRGCSRNVTSNSDRARKLKWNATAPRLRG